MGEDWRDVEAEGIVIHQIFYNEETRAKLDPAFVPLDNSANLRPDWYEFWVILNYLRTHELRDDCYYGFLSPSFGLKFGREGDAIVQFAREHRSKSEVLLFTHGWDQICYFVNQFEQCEYWHPGTMGASRAFFDSIGVNIGEIVSHTVNSTFSNYIVARPSFWRAWLQLAETFWDYCETRNQELGGAVMPYGRGPVRTFAKAFIQERIASVVLHLNRFPTSVLDSGHGRYIDENVFPARPALKRNFEAMDLLKQYYVATRDPEFMSVFMKMRQRIRIHPPIQNG
jgi:hypothetical protein